MIYCPRLMCNWDSWVALGPRMLGLFLPEGNCCDMNGAIGQATQLMPGVTEVRTHIGGKPDTRYVLVKDWAALPPAP